MGHWGVGPVTQDKTPGNVPIPRCFMSFQGLASPCPVYHRLAVGHTWDPGMWAHLVQMGHLEWDHSMVFRVIPGASIPVSCVLSVGHWSQTGHWDVRPATQDGTTWNAMCSVLFQGPTLPCPMYHQSAICLTRDTGLWAQQLETKHPGMFPSQGVPLSCTKHVWYSEHGMYYRFEIILERAMSVTHIAVILRMRTSPAYEEEFTKMDYPDARNEYSTS